MSSRIAEFPSIGGMFVLAVLSGCSLSPTVGRESPEQVRGTAPLLDKVLAGYPLPAPKFSLADPGSPAPVDYARYGEFQGLGTPQYRYVIKDVDGLKSAVGAGLYPDESAVRQDPGYLEFRRQGKPEGSHWSYLKSDDPQKAFYVWATAYEDKGVKTFFTAQVLEKAGLILPAVKAYHAVLVHFPRSVCWAQDGSFVWYVAQAAEAAILRLCRDYPDLNLELEGAYFDVQNGNDTDLGNDIVTVDPGRLVPRTLAQKKAALPSLSRLPVIETRGKGRVQLVKFQNGHWQMRVDGRPFFVRGATYTPTVIGIGPHSDPLFNDRWMFSDKDNNGRVDAPYDAWVDANANGRQDPDEPAVGDFQLLKAAGVNAIRLYVPVKDKTVYDPSLVNKPLLRDMYERFGIMVIVGDFLGAYTQGSGADWKTGTDYTDPRQRRIMKEVVRAKVMDLKDEPFVLMWLLGNENNMPLDFHGVNATRTNASRHPEAYAAFLEEVAQMIHEIDGNHPVAVGNIELDLVKDYREHTPSLDILGVNSYRGSEGFGSLWEEVSRVFDRPVLITEYGCDAYAEGVGEDEDSQLAYHRGNFRDIAAHQAGGPYTGNAIGGVVFEYLDEWWKDTAGHPEGGQQTKAQRPFPHPDGFAHEEWYGIVGQGSGKHSPFERRPRKAYEYYKEMAVY